MVEESLQYYGTGHRKTAVARVWLRPGEGSVTINDQPLDAYAPPEKLKAAILAPLQLTGLAGRFSLWATVEGGGISAQAEALRHGIAKALLQVDEGLRISLKRAGYLTRDPRVKERKKFGRKRARRGFQFSKR